MCMRWVWLGHIGKCGPHSSKLGVQYGPPACGRRSILHPQFLRIRFAFTDASSPDSPHSINTVMVDLLAKFGVDACKTSLEFISHCKLSETPKFLGRFARVTCKHRRAGQASTLVLNYVLLEYSTQSRAPETFTGVRNSEHCLFSLTSKSFFCRARTSTSNMRQEQGKKKDF